MHCYHERCYYYNYDTITYVKDINYLDNNNNNTYYYYQRDFMCNFTTSHSCFIFVGLRRSNSIPVTRRSNIIWLYDLEVRKDG